MSRPETRHKSPTPAECCVDAPCESGLRNNYFEGKRLTPDSFRVEQRYLVERRWLINRAIHGSGVVYGYAIKSALPNEYRHETASGRLTIGPGLALDPWGRELVQGDLIERALDQVIVLDETGKPIPSSPAYGRTDARYAAPSRRGGPTPSPEAPRECWLLSVHYAEQAVSPVTIKDPCHCERHEWDHVCETVRYSLRRIDCAECCRDVPCELECRCATGPCCDEHGTNTPRDPHGQRTLTERGGGGDDQEPGGQRPPCEPFTRGGCQCSCEHLTGLQPGGEGHRLYEIDEPCARVRVDLRHGVPLACVSLVQDECDRWVFDTNVEGCGPRRLVKRNDLLFDLIRGCDLTRISRIGWARWHRADSLVEWSEFAASFGTETPPHSGHSVTRDYWVEFSRPVREDTVRADCFAMTILVAEDEAGWWQPRRVPIVDVVTAGGPDVPAGHVTRATLVVDAGWVEGATAARKTIFNQDKALVEIEVFGDYIVDCNGQTVDADVRGLCAVPSGNGTPGGTLRSSFRIAARGPQTPSYDTPSRVQGA